MLHLHSDVTRISVSGNVANSVELKDMAKYNKAKKEYAGPKR